MRLRKNRSHCNEKQINDDYGIDEKQDQINFSSTF